MTALKSPCPHWLYDEHGWTDPQTSEVIMCPGGSVLPPDTLVIVKEGGDWPEWAINLFGGRAAPAVVVLDALAAAQPGSET
jgi:hypothetical protein